jgi:plasmid stabilization system protein ParE
LRRVVWTPEAADNLESIVTYIEAFNSVAAARMGRRLVDLASNLGDFSERGRPADGGTREMTIVPPYVLRYAVTADSVVILSIRHGARDLD